MQTFAMAARKRGPFSERRDSIPQGSSHWFPNDRTRGNVTHHKQAYTPEEVARILGLHPNSVYQMLKNGELPGVKAGRKWLVSKRRFHGWLDGE